MGTILNYIETYQHTSFAEMPINEIDFVILNELVYLPFDDYLTKEYTLKNTMSLKELYTRYWINHQTHHATNPILASTNRHQLFTAVVSANRYDNITISNFQHHYSQDINKQFCAATITLADQSIIVAFRGTDDTLVGWKEDFMLTYQESIPAQLDAEKYLKKIIPSIKHKLFITGHSKGGNLALYAALKIFAKASAKINAIYLFDSPGLTQKLLSTPVYQAIKPYVHHYIPEDSVVGRMMYHDYPPIIIKSSLISLFQHNIMNWKVNDTLFERAEKTTDDSDLIDVTLKEWTHDYTNKELEFFFESGFDLLKQANITTLNDISRDFIHFVQNMYNNSTIIPTEEKERFTAMIQQLFTIWTNKRKALRQAQWTALNNKVSNILDTNPVQAITDWLNR